LGSCLLPSEEPRSGFSPDPGQRPPKARSRPPETPKDGTAALAADFSDTAPSPASALPDLAATLASATPLAPTAPQAAARSPKQALSPIRWATPRFDMLDRICARVVMETPKRRRLDREEVFAKVLAAYRSAPAPDEKTKPAKAELVRAYHYLRLTRTGPRSRHDWVSLFGV